MNLIIPVKSGGRTQFFRSHPSLPAPAGSKVYDGDGLRGDFDASQPMRFLGCDTAEMAYRVPISPTASKGSQKLDGPQWATYLTDPFEEGAWPKFPDPGLHPLVQASLSARCGPDAAANHARHAAAGRQALIDMIQADMALVGHDPAQPLTLFVALSHEVFDSYGRLLAFVNTEVKDKDIRPRTYNERQIALGMATPFFIWPNVDPFRGRASVTDAALPPKQLRSLAAKGSLGRAREDARVARSAGLGIYNPADPLKIPAFELRMLGDRKLPSRWVIDLSANADDPTILPPEGYPLIERAEDRLFIPEEYVPLFVQKGWQAAKLVRW
ncbi:hypothetical protein FE840_015060 [Peteryoungia desertarenae]|uniref:Uncharacterized protein n=1 Tax=Peteryoungia desertarenae TaxID=1813451 RepID=A0ABX6QRD7_9HYPH|nr:hypothetical protein [Peteryoungia desertarenae]QLF70755.1 hypothetical protein FE840_015060 [Peteryoungia desertarenae]